jgi:hypothetical protein
VPVKRPLVLMISICNSVFFAQSGQQQANPTGKTAQPTPAAGTEKSKPDGKNGAGNGAQNTPGREAGKEASTRPTLEKQLESEYMLTTPTADNTDIVTAGSVLILQKKGFSAGVVSSKVVTQNTYKDGQIKAGTASAARRLGGLPGISLVPGVGSVAGTAAGSAGGSRDFVNGEKLFVTKITVDRAKNGIVFDLISDSYGDAGRYKATLRFEVPKAALASEDLAQIDPIIAQVIKSAPADQYISAAPQGGQQVALAEPPPAAQAPISPPPPPDPAAAPVSIQVGQTKDQVVAILGKPDKIIKVGTKEIYQYKDIKVTFVNGKVTDAQ